MENQNKKGFFILKNIVPKDSFHLGISFCKENWSKEIYLILFLGRIDVSFGCRWGEIEYAD